MFEALSDFYMQILVNLRVLWENPSGCFAVEELRSYTLLLLGLVGVRGLAHIVSSLYLRRRFRPFDEEGNAFLLDLARRTARRVGLKRAPEVRRFADRRPLAFALGGLRPAVFLAPRLVDKLSEEELRAVLAHEMVHIRRRDGLRTWAGRLALALAPALLIAAFAVHFIFSLAYSILVVWAALALVAVLHLAVWPAVRYLRELSCDDGTVGAIRDPLSLAGALLHVWRLNRGASPMRWHVFLASPHALLRGRLSLRSRIRRLADYKPPRWRPLLGRALRSAALALLLALAAFAVYFHWVGSHPTPDLYSYAPSYLLQH